MFLKCPTFLLIAAFHKWGNGSRDMKTLASQVTLLVSTRAGLGLGYSQLHLFTSILWTHHLLPGAQRKMEEKASSRSLHVNHQTEEKAPS